VAWWLLQHVVVTAALAALVAAVCRAVAPGPVVRHGLWLVVLIKFVAPPIVIWPFTVPDPLGLVAQARPPLSQPRPSRPIDSGGGLAILAGAEADDPLAGAITTRSDRFAVAVDASLAGWLLGIWIAGSVGVLTTQGLGLLRLARRVARGGSAEPGMRQRVARLSARLGVRPVAVRVIDGITSPAVFCLGRPRILWPVALARRPSDPWIDATLLHELAHIKRRDHLVGWIELVAAVIWWWNPLFWFVRSSLREQAELACDAWVVSILPDARRAYAESLLALSGGVFAQGGSPSLAVIGIRAGSRRALERRLVMIMKGQARVRLPLTGVAALVVVASATLPAWAVQTPPPPPPPVPAARTQEPPPPPPPPVPATAPELRPQKSTPPPPPPPPPAPLRRVTWQVKSSALPADGRQLIAAFDAERETIRQEAERRVTERREATVKALQDLQDRYTKEGRLDEATAIRDYLRAGGPAQSLSFSNEKGRWMIRKR
jgi:beta-lactamase regulating signal transducer with metallopeptidase domain